MMFGTVPARPASRLVTPPPAIAPCTCRKSIARSSRQATLCWVMASPLAWIEIIMPRNRNAGRSVPERESKVQSKTGPVAG